MALPAPQHDASTPGATQVSLDQIAHYLRVGGGREAAIANLAVGMYPGIMTDGVAGEVTITCTADLRISDIVRNESGKGPQGAMFFPFILKSGNATGGIILYGASSSIDMHKAAGDGNIDFVWIGTNGVSLLSRNIGAEDVPHMLMFGFDGTNCGLWVDGVKVGASDTYSGLYDAGNDLHMGYLGSGSSYSNCCFGAMFHLNLYHGDLPTIDDDFFTGLSEAITVAAVANYYNPDALFAAVIAYNEHIDGYYWRLDEAGLGGANGLSGIPGYYFYSVTDVDIDITMSWATLPGGSQTVNLVDGLPFYRGMADVMSSINAILTALRGSGRIEE